MRGDNPLLIWDVKGKTQECRRTWLLSSKARRNSNNNCLNNLPCKPWCSDPSAVMCYSLKIAHNEPL